MAGARNSVAVSSIGFSKGMQIIVNFLGKLRSHVNSFGHVPEKSCYQTVVVAQFLLQVQDLRQFSDSAIQMLSNKCFPWIGRLKLPGGIIVRRAFLVRLAVLLLGLWRDAGLWCLWGWRLAGPFINIATKAKHEWSCLSPCLDGMLAS